MGKQVATVEFSWDTQDAGNEGWYAVAKFDDGSYADDSMKIWFPVEVDEFGEDDSEGLTEALAEAFPGSEIIAA